MSDIAQLIRSNPIVDKDGNMLTRFYNWTQQVTQLQIIQGSGTPEGNIEASVTTLYMDTGGSSGNILYIKRDASVSGDRTKGWILV